jgi:hypothetical protein
MATAWSPDMSGISAAPRPTSQEDWRLPGCTEACRIVVAIRPGLLGRAEIVTHDPAAHEAWGRSHCRIPHGTPLVVETGPIRVDLGRVEVTVDGRAIHMTAVEMRLMLAFARVAGQLASVRSLVVATWGSEYVLDTPWAYGHLLRVNIARLRARLGRAGDLITTALGLGYRLELIAPGAQVPAREPLSSGGRPLLGAWASRFSRCICCGTTRYPHKARGRCSRCRSHVGLCPAPPSTQEDPS